MSAEFYIDVWIVEHDSVRPPRRGLCYFHTDKKGTWAVLPGGERRLIGNTAFLTQQAAHMRWQGNLDRTRKNNYMKFAHPNIWHRANEACRVNVYTPWRKT